MGLKTMLKIKDVTPPHYTPARLRWQDAGLDGHEYPHEYPTRLAVGL